MNILKCSESEESFKKHIDMKCSGTEKPFMGKTHRKNEVRVMVIGVLFNGNGNYFK